MKKIYEQILNIRRNIKLEGKYGILLEKDIFDEFIIQGYNEHDNYLVGMRMYKVPNGSLQHNVSFIILPECQCKEAVIHYKKIFRKSYKCFHN